MARAGVSYCEVSEVAVELLGEGLNPTIELIRRRLGTGSSTTIANHLRQWRQNQESSQLLYSKENLPTELVAFVKGLWEQLHNQTQDKMRAFEEEHLDNLDKLQRDLQKYKANNSHWQKMHEQWHVEKSKLQQEKLTLEQALEFVQKENVSLQAKQDSLLQQLQSKQELIDELHRLNKQAQENLEHYRGSAREQRILDQQQHENQKQQLQTEISTLKVQATIHSENILSLQSEHHALEHNNSHLEKNYNDIQIELKQAKESLTVIEKARMEYTQANQHLQIQFASLQESHHKMSNQFIDIQSENKVLSRQLADAKHMLTDSENKIKLLNLEKWELSGEKSMLEGQLKQCQKMITA